MTIDLSDSVALVTGAGRGLGQAMALALLQSGCAVCAVDIRPEGLSHLAGTADEEDATGRLLTLTTDISDLDACRRLVETVADTLGSPTMVLNNAVLGPDSINPDFHVRPVRSWEVSPETVARHFAVNVFAPFAIIHAALPAMLERGKGRIVNVSTSLETMQMAGFSPYGGTKAGLEAITVMMSKELSCTGVTANVLVPGGPAATPPHLGKLPEGWKQERLLPPEIMGPPAVWLASDASGACTGMRVNASQWDPTLSVNEAASLACTPAGWLVQQVALPI